MKITTENITGKVLRDTEVYIVEDNTFLNHLTVSKTTLHPDQHTNGHHHDGLEEVYYFLSGEGKMEVGEHLYQVTAGDVVLIPAGDFHKVYNLSENQELIFLAIFEKYERDS